MAERIVNAVMFADIVESTKLYERLGDDRAHALMASCMEHMVLEVRAHGGFVIKTIGDEVLCRFPTGDQACQCAHAIQQHAERLQEFPEVRIGLHYGGVLLSEDDIYGDVVNTAARMVEIARARQIIATEDLVATLPQQARNIFRRYDRARVKGKRGKLDIFEFVWSQEDITQCRQTERFASKQSYRQLRLSYGAQRLDVDLNRSTDWTIGRQSTCDLVLDTQVASRVHAVIKYQRGKFVLFDQSTNGTYVYPQTQQELYIRREEMPLSGSGAISFGAPRGETTATLVHYACLE